MTPTVIFLTADEREEASLVGRRRAQHHGHYSERQLLTDALGAIAEMAVAKLLGEDVLEDWRATRAFTTASAKSIPCDLGRAVQVRSTPYRKGCMAIRPRDPADHPYVLAITLVTPTECRVNVPGWLPGTDVVARLDWWKDGTTRPRFPDPAWCAPQSALRSIYTLPPEYVR